MSFAWVRTREIGQFGDFGGFLGGAAEGGQAGAGGGDYGFGGFGGAGEGALGGYSSGGSGLSGGDISSIVDSITKLGLGIAQAAAGQPVNPAGTPAGGTYAPPVGTASKIPWGLLIGGGALLGGLWYLGKQRR